MRRGRRIPGPEPTTVAPPRHDDGMLDVLFPVACAVCGVLGASPCAACLQALRRPPPLPPPPGVDRLVALLAYEGAGRELVARLKYRNARAALGWLAGALAGL